MEHPFPLSRKIQHSIHDGIECLKHGAFTETDVKALLIDLRELAKYTRDRLASETNDFTQANREFIEVCDFVAHASRDRGIVEKLVRGHVRTLHSCLNLSPEEFAKVPVSGVLNANKLVMSLAGIAFLGLSSSNRTLTHEYFSGLHTYQSEIALCILSLLQDAMIEIGGDEGFGMLQLIPHDGFYRVYCRVVNSKIEREARLRTGGTGRVVLGFPVMISAAKCLDASILSADLTVFPPPVFETYRNGESGLQPLRIEK